MMGFDLPVLDRMLHGVLERSFRVYLGSTLEVGLVHRGVIWRRSITPLDTVHEYLSPDDSPSVPLLASERSIVADLQEAETSRGTMLDQLVWVGAKGSMEVACTKTVGECEVRSEREDQRRIKRSSDRRSICVMMKETSIHHA